MSKLQDKRSAELMNQKIYFYVIDKFVTHLYYDRARTNRSIVNYSSTMVETIKNQIKYVLKKEIEDFEFNEHDLIKYKKFIDRKIFKGTQVLNEFIDFYIENLKLINFDVNQLFIGPYGTDKRRIVKKKAVELVNGNIPDTNKDVFDEYQKLSNNRIFYKTFDKTTNYANFIEGINKDGKIVNGLFKKICHQANMDFTLNTKEFLSNFKKILKNIPENKHEFKLEHKLDGKNIYTFYLSDDSIWFKRGDNSYKELTEQFIYDEYKNWFGPEYHNRMSLVTALKTVFDNLTLEHRLYNPLNKYVLIIDNFNKGNIHEIFGDVLPLIPKNFRKGQTDGQKIKLSLSGELFFVPDNVFILAISDTNSFQTNLLSPSIRNMFNIRYLSSNPDKLINLKINDIDLNLLLKRLNEKIEFIKGKDYTIGHKYFDKIDTLDDLKHLFNTQLIPILEVYSNYNTDKLLFLLGKDFFEVSEFEIDGKNLKRLKLVEIWDAKMFINIYSN